MPHHLRSVITSLIISISKSSHETVSERMDDEIHKKSKEKLSHIQINIILNSIKKL